MSYADQVFISVCRDILAEGFWDTDLPVRPRWTDGTPAHTVKKFGVVNRYDLREEFPIMTLRPTAFRSCVDELLWIWQKKSNNIHDLNSHVWDAWADEAGSIGKAYGYQLGVRHQYGDGWFDQVDRVLKDLRENPASRRMVTSLFNHHDLHRMGLYPCAWSMTFNVTGNTLNAVLNQRSQDMLTASNWNVCQYAVLLHMMARSAGLEAGELVHVTADPVIRVKKADPALGLEILAQEGCPRRPDRLTVGWAVKSRGPDRAFLREVERCIRWLREEYGADSVLIPFFHDEDWKVCDAVAQGLDGQAGCLRQKYLSEQTLSIIGCMDVLVGVRLHALIYAAVMGVPMIGISYDPKVDSFLASIGQSAPFTVEDFTLEKFQAAFQDALERREELRESTARRLDSLIAKLDRNEELIRAIMERKK